MWKEQERYLGDLLSNSTIPVLFEHEGEDIIVEEITAGCGCIKTQYIETKNQIIVYFKPPVVPYHLRNQGQKYYLSTKKVVVKHNKGSDILTFTSRVFDSFDNKT